MFEIQINFIKITDTEFQIEIESKKEIEKVIDFK